MNQQRWFGPGWRSEEHRARFFARRDESRLGTPAQPRCGARTRGGGTCSHLPLDGFTRCLRHGGRAVARAYRERQMVALAAGELSPHEFMSHERRRAANRLRDAWKKNPWLHGSTLSLREHENRFRDEMSALGHDVDRMPPGVVDTARWRFRRCVIDAARGGDWREFVHDVLPKLLLKAGPMPEGWEPVGPGEITVPPSFVVAAVKVQGTKRQIADTPRSAPTPRETKIEIVKPPTACEAVEFSKMVLEHRDVLAPLLARLETESERTRLLRGFVDRLCRPDDPSAIRGWGELLRSLGLVRS